MTRNMDSRWRKANQSQSGDMSWYQPSVEHRKTPQQSRLIQLWFCCIPSFGLGHLHVCNEMRASAKEWEKEWERGMLSESIAKRRDKPVITRKKREPSTLSRSATILLIVSLIFLLFCALIAPMADNLPNAQGSLLPPNIISGLNRNTTCVY